MCKTTILKNKKKKQLNRGFITIEVIMALLIAFGFLMVSLQAMVAAMAFKVKAQEEQRADKLIQEEIEALNDLGSTLNFGNANDIADGCNGVFDEDGNPATTTDRYGYGQGLWNVLNESAITTITTSTNTTNTVTTLGKVLTITGTQVALTTANSSTPHRILGIFYQVTKPDEDGDTNPEVITNRYVEVIPDAALECP